MHQTSASLGIENNGFSILALTAGGEVAECLVRAVAHKGRMIRLGEGWATKCVVQRALREGLHRRQFFAVLAISMRVEGIKRSIMMEH
jgi:hypothetical protein